MVNIKNTDNIKCWKIIWSNESVQLVWKILYQDLLKLNIYKPYVIAIPSLVTYST